MLRAYPLADNLAKLRHCRSKIGLHSEVVTLGSFTVRYARRKSGTLNIVVHARAQGRVVLHAGHWEGSEEQLETLKLMVLQDIEFCDLLCVSAFEYFTNYGNTAEPEALGIYADALAQMAVIATIT